MAETQDPSREPALCLFSPIDQETPWTEHSFTQAVNEYLLSPVAQTAVHFPDCFLFSGHTDRLHFPASLPARCGQVTESRSMHYGKMRYMPFPGLDQKNLPCDPLFLLILLVLVKCKGGQGPRTGYLASFVSQNPFGIW